MERARSGWSAARVVGALFVALSLVPAGCDHKGRGDPQGKGADPHPSAEHRAPTGSAPAVLSSRPANVQPAASTKHKPALPGSTDGCPDGMVRVEGEYCPAAVEECMKYHPDFERHRDDKNVSARCLEFRPSRCISKEREHMAFCVDRYEYPDKVGEMPWVLTTWRQADKLCRKAGKRLCTEDEFNFACEGPEMRPYATGFKRDAKACNIDKTYVMPDHEHRMLTYHDCQKDDRCEKELERLDQRHAIGSVNTCVSWAGVIDMNGNVNEWVSRPGEKSPHRGGLKGGWWGPVRDRCRPTVIFHKEFDYGYEAGFRCCSDLENASAATGAGAATDAGG